MSDKTTAEDKSWLHALRMERTLRAKKEFNPNLEAWSVIPPDMRVNNIKGKVPKLKAKLGGNKTNAELAKEWGISDRQASKVRNHKKTLQEAQEG